MRNSNKFTIVSSVFIAFLFCMPAMVPAKDSGEEVNIPGWLPHETYGHVYLDGEIVTDFDGYTLRSFIDFTEYGNASINFDGIFLIDTAIDFPLTPIKEGGMNGDIIYYQLDPIGQGKKVYWADETATWLLAGWDEMDLHFKSKNCHWPLKISSIVPNPSYGNDFVSIYNPSTETVNLDDWKLADNDTWEMPLTGYSVPPFSEIDIDLGGDILSNTEGDEIALCWQLPSETRAQGDWVAYDLVEYGEAQTMDNSVQPDYPIVPAVDMALTRINPLEDNDNCSLDFEEVPLPQDVSDVYFAKTGSMIDHTPSIIQADNGTFFMAYEQGTSGWYFTINLMWSPDGVNWDMDNTIVSTGSGGYGNRHPTLIQRQDGDLQVVYLSDRAGAYSDFEIYTSISSDGQSWTEYGPLALSGPAINPFIIQQEGGSFAMSYQRYGSGSDGSYFATSSDGITWATTGSRVADRSLPRLMKANGGDYLMTFQGGNTGDFEIRYKTSSDGLSWGTEQTLTDTGNSHDSFPMQLANGSYMIFFATSLGGGGYDLYRKWSPDMNTWSDDEYLETNNFRFDTEPHACQIAGNQSFLLSWGYESSGAVGAYEDVDIALMWIEDISWSSSDISLDAGWNMISLPLIPADTSVEQVLSSIAGKYSRVRTYDAADSADPWKMYNPTGPAMFNDLTNLDHTMGIWILATEPCTLTILGTVPDITDITLRAGWNLVGYPSNVFGKSAALSLTGTGADIISVFQAAAPYVVDTTNLGSVTMTPKEAYWVHVPADTLWMVDNVPPPLPTPYLIFGYVQLYDGTFAGGYSPLASSGGATLDAEWYNPSIAGWDSMTVPVNPSGQFTIDLPDSQDGGIVYLNATFDAPYGNNGYNWTVVDHMMGMSMQNVICGVPYEVIVVNPVSMQQVAKDVNFPAEYWVLDRDGDIAQGYFTFEGFFEWYSTDPGFIAPMVPKTFQGTSDPTPGIGISTLKLRTYGVWLTRIIEGTTGGNMCLTPWTGFYIDPDNAIPGWYSDRYDLDLEVV